MPIYEYLCQDCSMNFEVKASLEEKDKGLKPQCVFCGSPRAIQVFGNISIGTMGKDSFTSVRGCGPNAGPGCCG